MGEKLVKTSVAESVKEVIETTVKAINPKEHIKPPANRKEEHKGIVEAVLRGVATRIVLSHSFKDLGKTLSDTLSTVQAGGMDAEKIDLLKGRVLDTVKKIKDGKEGEAINKFLDEHFKQGKYEEAAKFLKDMVDDPGTGLLPVEQAETGSILGKVKKESSTTDAELLELVGKQEDIKHSNEDRQKKIREKSDEIQTEIGREEMKVLIENKSPKDVQTERKIDDAKRSVIIAEMGAMNDFDKSDAKFIAGILIGEPGSGDREIDFKKLDKKLVYHVWYRTAGILGRDDWTGGVETEMMLREMNESARKALLDFATENLVIEAMTPTEARWLGLPKEEQDLVMKNLDFLQNTHGDFRLLKQMQEAQLGSEMVRTRTNEAMMQLLTEYGDKKLENGKALSELLILTSKNKWEWNGSKELLYDICREEIYGIQGQLTQENMSQLVFEDSAQKYLALMRIDVGDDLELEKVKDAITKNLYVEFAVKTMWRSGGNMEGWQRAASVLTQESDENFFQLMQLGEMLKVKDVNGDDLSIGRFDWRDLMTLAEMKADNGQYYLTYMAGQSQHLRKERKPEFAAALADLLVQKRLLKGELTQAEAKDLMLKVQNGGYNFTDRQVRSMVDYMQFLEVATFRGGEFGLNQSMVKGKFEYTDLPNGEVVHKTGPWAILYDWKYPVTKYGGEWVGKLFLPNVNVLSYARGETLGHFISVGSNVDSEGGIGARDFFFSSSKREATYANGKAILNKSGEKMDVAEVLNDFWGDVIFDTRTGDVNNKTAINRAVESARSLGIKKFAKWDAEKKLGFVEFMDFSNMEEVLGYAIPGATKLEKFEWMVSNYDYSFWRMDLLKSKRIGDWVGKYVPKKYEDARLKLAAFANAPGTATLGAVRDIISEYSDESTFNAQAQEILQENRKTTLGLKQVDEDGHERKDIHIENPDALAKKLSTLRYRIVGYKHADRGKSTWTQDGAGDFYGVTEQWHSPTEGYHMGSGFAISRQQGKELFQDPMYFEKMEIDNQFHAGMLSRKEWGKAKKEWQKKAYLGDTIYTFKFGKDKKGQDRTFNFRWGHIPLFTPISLVRGWWVDKMQLDWQDFLLATRKNNEETWAKLKKIIGI